MIRKLVMTAGVVTLGGLLLFGTDLWSYATTLGQSARRHVKRQVPVGFEIDRARRMVANLLPEIRQNMHTIAEEEVEVERLQQEIARRRQELDAEQDRILALRSHLGENQSTYQFAGRTYTPQQVRQDLARRFERFKTGQATLASKRQMLQARSKSLAAARDKLEGMIAAKRDLEVQVEHLEARLKMIQAAQTTTEVEFDDSRLARARSLVGDLRKRLDVAQRLLDAEGQMRGEIPLDETVPDDLAEQIDEYFDASEASADLQAAR